jgi:hypothetical protein
MHLTRRVFQKLSKKTGAECYIHESGGDITSFQYCPKAGRFQLFPVRTMSQARKRFDMMVKTEQAGELPPRINR